MNNNDYKEALFDAASIFNERLGTEFSEDNLVPVSYTHLSPEIVVELDRCLGCFHCSSFPLRGSSGKGEDRRRAA